MDRRLPPDHTSSEVAQELTEAAAHADGRAARLWRLEWAQVFRRLADLGGERDPDGGGGLDEDERSGMAPSKARPAPPKT